MSSSIGAAGPGPGTQGKKKAFIDATFAMVSNPAHERCVRWTADGTRLEIRNVTLFCETALPAHFKHQNLSSFVRQLNMYGFEKERHPVQAEGQVFHHEFFLRGRPDVLYRITRKTLKSGDRRVAAVPAAASPSASTTAGTSSAAAARNETAGPGQRLTRLESENHRLEAENKRLKGAIAEHFHFFSEKPASLSASPNATSARESAEALREKDLLMAYLKHDALG
jgi:hypothetical protein